MQALAQPEPGGKTVYQTPIRGPQVWVQDATVQIIIPSHVTNSQGQRERTFVLGSRYAITLPPGAYVSDIDTSAYSPAISTTDWTFVITGICHGVFSVSTYNNN